MDMRTKFASLTQMDDSVTASTAQRSDLTGCPWHDVKSMLRSVGLRPTRQRMSLG